MATPFLSSSSDPLVSSHPDTTTHEPPTGINTDFNIGAFWGAFGATLVPYYNAYGAYVTNPTAAAASQGNPGNPAGLAVPAFNASFAYFLVFMGNINPVFHPLLANSTRRAALSDLPHLLPSDEYRLLRHLPQPDTRLRLPRCSILQLGTVL